MKQTNVLNRFINIYKDALNDTKIGLIIGAGVTHDSKVPTYSEFALKAFFSAYDSPDDFSFKKSIKPEVKSYISNQLNLSTERREVEPDEVFLLTKLNFRQDLESGSEEWNREWTRFCATQLYKDCIGLTDWRVKKTLYDKNRTLNALITFCAASHEDLPEPWKTQLQSSRGFREVGINPRIGGVLTTNYDSLFEAAFNHKYTRSKGRSYGMRPRLEGSGTTFKFDCLPVEHIHGYLSHNISQYEGRKNNKNRLTDFVSAETDYFRAFYESMRFGNYTAMSFLGNHHTLFVGCSMEDQNIRRFLFHLRNATDANTEKFAMLKNGCKTHHNRSEDYCKMEDGTFSPGWLGPRCLTPRDLYYEEVLATYGVSVIWLCEYWDIYCLLKYIYEKAGGNWDYVYGYKRH